MDSYTYSVNAISNHEFNFKLFSSIVKLLDLFHELDFEIKNEKKSDVSKSKFKFFQESKKYYLGNFFLFLNKLFSKEFIIITEPYYQTNFLYNLIWFFIKSKGKIIHYEFNNSKAKFVVDNSLRKKLSFSTKNSKNQLLNISSKLVLEYMPICYVENFSDLRKKSIKWHKTNPGCRSIFTANAIHYNEFFKHVCAINQKIPLSIIQHGSGYGTDKLCSSEKYETILANKFYTWGWGQFKLPHQKLKPPINNYLSNKRILFTFPSFGLYLGVIDTIALNFIHKDQSLIDYEKFIDNLSSETKNNIYNRQVNQSFIKPINSKNKIKLDKIKSFQKSLLKSKIHVTNHFGTPFLESISMNIPTILILKNYEDYLRDNVVDIFNELRDVNIIFENPMQASKHINKYYNSINSWWMTEKTQRVLKNFRFKFCFSSKDWKKKWLNEMKNYIQDDRYL